LLQQRHSELPAPAVEDRNNPISQAAEKRQERGHKTVPQGAIGFFQISNLLSKLCSALVPAPPNMKPGHLNPHVNCKTLPSHPFRCCPFFQGKAAQFKQSVPHASHILFSSWYLMQLNCQAIFNSSSDLSYAFMDGQI